MARKVSSDNVIRCLTELRFGAASSAMKARFRRDLKQFRILTHAEISDTAIDNWFQPGATGPQQARSFGFLYDYFSKNVGRGDGKSQAHRDLFGAVEDFLRPPVHSAGIDLAADAHQQSTRGQPVPSVGAVDRWTSSDHETLLQFRALHGAYQIVRPHSSAKDVYVLEAMAVVVDETQGSAKLHMYSHNQRAPRFAYEGELYGSYRYCFSLIRRAHENNPSRYALRCVTLNVGAQREAEGYLSSPCISGLILRGVAGTDGPTRAIGVPILALRTPDDAHQFTQASFPLLRADVRRLADDSSLVIGKVGPSDELFALCRKIFGALAHLSSGLVLQTMTPETLERLIVSLAQPGEARSHFAVWKGAVDRFALEV